MKHPQPSQDPVDSVLLSSSPAPSPGLEAEAADLLPSPPSATLTSASSNTQCPSHEFDHTLNCISENNLNPEALLSPFAVIKTETSNLESTGAQSAVLRQTLDSLTSSPSAFEHSSSTSTFSSNVLQSPFGTNFNATTSFSKGLFLSSSASPGHCSSFPTDTTDSTKQRLEYYNRADNELPVNLNDLSDFGESITVCPSTPKASQVTPAVASSSPYFVNESTRKDVHENVYTPENYITDADHSTSSLSLILEEPPSLTALPPRSMSPDDHLVLPHTRTEASEPKIPFDATLQESENENTACKRLREVEEHEAIPARKRMTLASQQKQHKKLASPFRSPLLSRANPGNIATPDREHTHASLSSPLSSAPRRNSDEDKLSTLKDSTRLPPATVSRPRTPLSSSAKAKAQFKSPLMMSSTAASSSSRVSNTRTIQELERKVQLLKRAIKITKESDEEKLEQLVKKWRSAGREAAWELWQTVRDNDESSDVPYPGTNSRSSGGLSSRSWGWAGTSAADRCSNWGWEESSKMQTHEDDCRSEELKSPTKLQHELLDTLQKTSGVYRASILPPTARGAYFEQQAVPLEPAEETDLDEYELLDDEDHKTTQPKSLGTMLHQLGIAHETLGWVEDEGDFVDA